MKSFFLSFFIGMLIWLIIPSAAYSQEPQMYDFLNQYYNSTEKTKYGQPKLYYAISKGYRNIALTLLKSGEDPNVKYKWDAMTPFVLAILKEDEEMVLKMLECGADVNLKCSIDSRLVSLVSPIWYAVANNLDVKITKILCDFGCKIIERPVSEWSYLSPISNAIGNTKYNKFKVLADHLTDEDLNLLDGYKNNVFAVIMLNNFQMDDYVENSLNIARYLLNRKVAIETENGSALASATIVGNIPLMKLLLEYGANVNFGSNERFNSLYEYSNPIVASLDYYLIYKNKNALEGVEPLKVLLEYYPNVNFSMDNNFNYGFSPLGYAIRNNLVGAVELLINYGADVNILEISGKTPLICAIEAKNLDFINLLLGAGADPRKSGINDERSPIDIALEQGNTEILNLLIHAEANMY